MLYDQTYRDINRRSQAWREVAEIVVALRLFWGVYIQFTSGFFASYVTGGRFMWCDWLLAKNPQASDTPTSKIFLTLLCRRTVTAAEGANACLGEGERKPQRRINRRVTMVTMGGKSSSLLCGRLQRHLQAWHMYYSVSRVPWNTGDTYSCRQDVQKCILHDRSPLRLNVIESKVSIIQYFLVPLSNDTICLSVCVCQSVGYIEM